MNTDLLFLVAFIIPLLAQGYVSITYAKYSKQENKHKVTGYDVAREILDKNDLKDLYIVETEGVMADHYDPKRKTVKLSHDVYHGQTVAALAIAAHECGHAIQDKEGYSFMRIRSFIFPVVNLGTKFAYVVLILGLIFSIMNLIWVAIGLVGLGLLFQLVTLPVEFDASKRAKKEIEKYNLADAESLSGTGKMLGAAAMTYVAGVLASALEVLRLVLIFTRRD